jgi:hypothetical protein
MKPAVLEKFADRFLDWLNDSRLEEKRQKVYRNGWRLLKSTPFATHRKITIPAGHCTFGEL